MKISIHVIALTLASLLLVYNSSITAQTYGTDINALYLIDFTPGSCSSTFIGNFEDPSGTNLIMGDLALCPDGSLYGIGGAAGAFGLYQINPSTAVCNLVVPTTDGYNALACAPDFRIFGVGGVSGGEVVEFFPGTMTLGVIGDCGFISAGDLVQFDGKWYLTAISGLIEIPNIDAPSGAQLLYAVGIYAAITVSPTNCNKLILPGIDYYEIDVETGNLTMICNLGPSAAAGLTSMFEFNPPIGCAGALDLDKDDSSGAFGSDYNGQELNCLTLDGIHIADDDVQVNSPQEVVDITISFESGAFDLPDEVFVLNSAPNIAISGSGTDYMILSNSGGASNEDFEQALRDIKYYNNKSYPTPGERIIKVVYEDIDGNFSNDAFATIKVIEFIDLIVDLGPNIIACENENIILDAGPGDTYLWSDATTNQTLFPNASGEYHVTVTQYPYCPGKDSVQLDIFPNVFTEIEPYDPICPGEELPILIISDFDSLFNITIQDLNSGISHEFNDVEDGDLISFVPEGETVIQLSADIDYPCSVVFDNFINIEINDLFFEESQQVICNGDSVFFNGEFVNSTGVYLDTINVQGSCDSVLSLTLTVNQTFLDTINLYTCVASEEGFQVDTFSNFFGCDSIVTKFLSYTSPDSVLIESTSCDINNVVDTVLFLTNQYGCDSVVHIITTYSDKDSVNINLTTCNPMEEGLTIDTLISSIGCDSLVYINTQLIPPDSMYITSYTCDTSMVSLTILSDQNKYGCDSLTFVNVLMEEIDTVQLVNFTCTPSEAGITIDTLTTITGCDSIVVKTLLYIAPDTIVNMTSSCNVDEVGIFEEHILGNLGCDSIVIVDMVEFVPLDTTIVFLETCNPNEAGEFISEMQTITGCDSIVVSHVALVEIDTTFLSYQTCNLNEAGLNIDTLNSLLNCDSIVVTNAIFVPIDTTYIDSTTCSLTEAGLSIMSYQTSAGCDSVVSRNVNYVGSDTTWLNSTTCDENEAGIQLTIHQNNYDCDSIVIVDNHLLPSHLIVQTDTICDPTLETVVTFEYLNQYGCDSIIMLERHLLIPTVDLGLDIIINEGEIITLDYNTNIQGTLIWTSDPYIDESNFEDLTIAPLEDLWLTLQIIDQDGCLASDDLFIKVNKSKEIILPNIFSPNGDGLNDELTLLPFVDQIKSIQSFNIFDRWGNKVLGIQDIAPEEFLWDGKMNGDFVSDGVYVIVATLILNNDKKVNITSDLTIIK